jgi:energy-coupling factor transporter ATP-binding protein EcfA2
MEDTEMKEHYYNHDNIAIINLSGEHVTTVHQLINADEFTIFLERYVWYLKDHAHSLYEFLCKDHADLDAVVKDLKNICNLLIMMNYDKVDVPYAKLPKVFLEIIEQGYQFWRRMERYSVMEESSSDEAHIKHFIAVDTGVNAIALDLYRTIQQNVQGTADNVYRQLQAGTNASLLVAPFPSPLPSAYDALKGIPFIKLIMLRTPLILHPKSSKRTNKFVDADHNPIEDFHNEDDEYFCYPAKAGETLIWCYFHRNYMTSCTACANLFALAKPEEMRGKKPDAILLFGCQDGTSDTTFYHDTENDLWVGKVSDAPEIDYFGYTKKAILTLHNLVMMQRGWLPIHGAMVNVYFKDGTKKGIMFMGDSGAGKSETIEALSHLADDVIDHQETVFDDMGTLHLDKEGKIRAQGTEIGAFVRLDDLDKGTAYKDLDRSIFFNPEKANARVVLPAVDYDTVITDHEVDCFLYANNYTDQRGMHLFQTKEEAEPVFKEGRRFALGTTQENGLSTTFFANPFGPMQRQEECTVLIDRIFMELFRQNIPVGEVYTCLGLPEKGNGGIEQGAKALLDFVQKK